MFPTAFFAEECCQIQACNPREDRKCAVIALLTNLDLLITITTLAVGLLAYKGYLNLPPAAMYAMIGVGGAIPAIYLLGTIYACWCGPDEVGQGKK